MYKNNLVLLFIAQYKVLYFMFIIEKEPMLLYKSNRNVLHSLAHCSHIIHVTDCGSYDCGPPTDC